MSEKRLLASIRNLTVFDGRHILVKGLDLDIAPGDLLGVAGESGSGKTMFVRAMLNILPEGVSYTAERLEMFGTDCRGLSPAAWRKLVGAHIGLVPQNTIYYLHPMMKIRRQIADSFVSYKRGTRAQGLQRAADLLMQVGFDDPERVLNAYVWELSGGMRQRVNIAMALMNSPDLLIADEPTTALDAAIQRQIMELFMDISRETGIAIMMISHDLGVLHHYSRRSMIMYAGRAVEAGSTEAIFRTPAHPYTRALIGVIPSLHQTERLVEIPGHVPDSGRETDLCIFRDRCKEVCDRCQGIVPQKDLGNGHFCLCAKAGGGGYA